jgi:hypothetical protein
MHHVAYKMMTLVAIRGPALPVTPKLALLFPFFIHHKGHEEHQEAATESCTPG